MVDTLWQVVAAYLFAFLGGWISTSLRLEHKQLCALISFAAGTLLGVMLFAILPESLAACPWWAVILALATGYALFSFISKHVHHVCPACAASHFDADATRHFSEIATALIVALAIHSTTDGLALGIQGETPATDVTKWSLFSALCIHKLPEGLAQKLAGRYRFKDKEIELTASADRLYLMPIKGGVRTEVRQLDMDLIVDDVTGYGPKITREGEMLKMGLESFQRVQEPAIQSVPDKWQGLIGEYGGSQHSLHP